MASDDSRGGIHIKHVQGAFAIGDHNSVVNQPGAAQPDPAAAELLKAVRELRADLARLNTTDETAALDGELADAEDEIGRTGRAEPGLLGRIGQALTRATAVTGLLASATALSDSVRALIGE
ncbi:hypothetical protein [Streptomyces apocyni]|uniref:hypothetical protein n=1 Tax=Streptomyces apocyni TaxID=2654677 RepID=UPI0012E9C1E7|nr:hypothetical protein [Streptomyces apocyni]